ncbi:cell division protein FtsX [Limibaculum sp. M0105]|uniref:Cell division protein FtsX n=1 Tax=Thermohalobaculum xanthum TaxID=2753746 RepID=A0A8J7M6S0_9RHOB|nr:cell division protein FtsX [Thermohalobaculum xanthum]MBK0399389.1 cell division protein FtsX [Thermohalobaculum xanthum]
MAALRAMAVRLGLVADVDGGPPIVPPSGWSAWLTTLTACAMAFLALLTIAAGLAAGGLAEDWQADLAEAATLRLPASTDAATLERVIDQLSATPGIASARALDPGEQAALLEPWLGRGARLADLPLPVLVDLRIEGSGPDVPALEANLGLVTPGAVYDDHAGVRAPLGRAAEEVRRIALAGTVLVVLAAAGMVALAARASLAANAELVRIVRLIGGEDAFITRAFVGRIVRRTALGAIAGAALGAGALAALPVGGLSTALAPVLLPGPGGLAALAAVVALGFVAVGWGAARATLRVTLREMQ